MPGPLFDLEGHVRSHSSPLCSQEKAVRNTAHTTDVFSAPAKQIFDSHRVKSGILLFFFFFYLVKNLGEAPPLLCVCVCFFSVVDLITSPQQKQQQAEALKNRPSPHTHRATCQSQTKGFQEQWDSLTGLRIIHKNNIANIFLHADICFPLCP